MYSVPNAYKWAMFTKGLKKLYITSDLMINLSFEDFTYHEFTPQIQELAREEVSETTVPIENQQRSSSTFAEP